MVRVATKRPGQTSYQADCRTAALDKGRPPCRSSARIELIAVAPPFSCFVLSPRHAELARRYSMTTAGLRRGGTAARIRWEKSGELSAACAASLILDRVLSSANGRSVSNKPRL